MEVTRGARSLVRQSDEQSFAPWAKGVVMAASDGDSGEEVERVRGVEVELVGEVAAGLLACLAQYFGDVLVVLEAVAGGKVNDAVTSVAKVVNGEPLIGSHVRHVLRFDGHNHHSFVQHLVVGDVGPQGQRGGVFG